MSHPPLLVAEDLHRAYGALQAVTAVGFQARRGEVLGLLGPNGAGKTTTLSMLCGVLAPDRGRVEIAGVDLAQRPREARRQLGYLPEQPPIYRELTVDAYLDYCGGLHGLRGRRLREARERAKARCALGEVGRRLLGNLSKGYQQRAGIAQAILHEPAVVVLDEPTVGLDPLQLREVRALIAALREQHCVVLSSHVLAEVQAVCDRVVILVGGRVALDSPLAALDAAEPRHWRVRLEQPPGRESLLAQPGVREALETGPGLWRLEVAIAVDTEGGDGGTGLFAPARFAEHAARAGWGLAELTPERPGLEETFVRLVHGGEALP